MSLAVASKWLAGSSCGSTVRLDGVRLKRGDLDQSCVVPSGKGQGAYGDRELPESAGECLAGGCGGERLAVSVSAVVWFS